MFLDCDYGKTIVIFEISTLEYVKDKKIKSGTKITSNGYCWTGI